ncbi:MAG: SCO family protein [Cocleimonas sp.]|nr:SCO family protein [Cocleimonas sp.]
MTNEQHETDPDLKKKPAKNSRVTKILFLMLVLALLITIFKQLKPPTDFNKPISQKTYIGLPDRKPLPAVTLEQAGKGKISTETFQGKWHMLLFGYTFCPDVCPVELSILHKMMDQLRKRLPAEQLPQIVFISVDPERDSPEGIEKYVKHFDSDFIGVTGEDIDLKVLTLPFGISWMKERSTNPEANTADKHYLVSHSTTIVLVNPETNVTGFFPAPHSEHEMTIAYEKIIKKEKSNAVEK